MLVFCWYLVREREKKIKICVLRIAQFYFRALLVARITLIRADYIFTQEHCAKIKLTRKVHELRVCIITHIVISTSAGTSENDSVRSWDLMRNLTVVTERYNMHMGREIAVANMPHFTVFSFLTLNQVVVNNCTGIIYMTCLLWYNTE